MCSMNIDNENRDNASIDNKMLPLLERKKFQIFGNHKFF